MVAFHAQQCVEKCFKAFLEYAGQRVPKEHSTLKLYGLVKNEFPVEVQLDLLTDLDDLYIDAGTLEIWGCCLTESLQKMNQKSFLN